MKIEGRIKRIVLAILVTGLYFDAFFKGHSAYKEVNAAEKQFEEKYPEKIKNREEKILFVRY